MMKNDELLEVNGGAVHWAVIAGGIVAAVSFVVGFFDGLVRPFKCRQKNEKLWKGGDLFEIKS